MRYDDRLKQLQLEGNHSLISRLEEYRCKAAIPSGLGWSTVCPNLACSNDVFCEEHGGDGHLITMPFTAYQSSTTARVHQKKGQCDATNAYGRQCRQFRTVGSTFCYVHTPSNHFPPKEGIWHDEERMPSEWEPISGHLYSALTTTHSLPFDLPYKPFSEMPLIEPYD